MKIVIDARMYGLEHTGIGRYTIHLVEHLSKLDHKNSYIILLRKKYFGVLDLPKNFTQRLADFPHYSLSEQIQLPLLIYSLKADVVHFLHLNVPLLYNKAFVVTVHDLTISSENRKASTRAYPVFLVKKLAYKIAAWHAIKHAKKIITPTEAVKDNVAKTYKVPSKNMAVTYEGVDLKDDNNHITIQPSNNEAIDAPYFLYVGNAYPHKNLELFLDAFKEFQKSNDSYRLVLVVKNGFFKDSLKEQIQEKNLTKSVLIKTSLSDDELVPLYKDSTAFIFPSLKEGFGLPGLEAMRAKTLVIASDIPVFHEVYKDNALYFDPNDIEELVKRMEAVLKMSKTDRENRVKKAYNHSLLFSWEKMAETTIEIYLKKL